MKPVVAIIGAGPAGLTAALELVRDGRMTPIVFEASDQVGGISRTVEYQGNRMDIGGHRFFSKSDWVMNWWRTFCRLPATRAPSKLSITGSAEASTRTGRRRPTTA
jgi:protoporphyrinogen oxidase